MWIYILAGLLALACTYLTAQHIQLKNDISKMRGAAKEMRAGNPNQRFRVRTSRADTLSLCGELNGLCDSFQEAMERTHFLEEDRERMVSNISHDLRTPLTAMLGYIEALQKDKGLTEEEQEAFLQVAADKGASLKRLMQGFFELSQLEEADGAELSRVDLAELARAALLGFYSGFAAAGITPATGIPEHPVYVQGNADYLKRVIDNLVSNALRYGADGGGIGLDVRADGQGAVLEVWDRGRGIPADDLPYIFERLYTVEASRSAPLRSAGLGLAIAKALVEKQGGSIAAESIPCEKTTFSVRLPAAS